MDTLNNDACPEFHKVRLTVLSCDSRYESGRVPVAVQVSAIHQGTTSPTVLTQEDSVEYLDALDLVVALTRAWIARSYEVEVIAGCYTYESLQSGFAKAGLADRVRLFPRSDLSSYSDKELRYEMEMRADRSARQSNEFVGDGLTIGHSETPRDWSLTPV